MNSFFEDLKSMEEIEEFERDRYEKRLFDAELELAYDALSKSVENFRKKYNLDEGQAKRVFEILKQGGIPYFCQGCKNLFDLEVIEEDLRCFICGSKIKNV